MTNLLNKRIAFQLRVWLVIGFGFFSSWVFAGIPSASDGLGIIGNCYFWGNVNNGTPADFDDNWNNSGSSVSTGTTDSLQLPNAIVNVAGDRIWYFNNV